MKIKSRALIKILILVPFLLLVYVLQTTVCCRMLIFGAKPLLLPLAAVVIALSEGSIKGGAYGLFAGILCDISFNQPTVQFTLILTVIGIAVGITAETLLVKNFTSYLLCAALAISVCSLWQAMPMMIFRSVSFYHLLGVSIRQLLASIVFVLPMYFIFRLIDRSPRF